MSRCARLTVGRCRRTTTSLRMCATSTRATSSRWCGRASTARIASWRGGSCRISRTRRPTCCVRTALSAATGSRSSCRRRRRRPRSSSVSGSSARSCSRCRCSTVTIRSVTASPTPVPGSSSPMPPTRSGSRISARNCSYWMRTRLRARRPSSSPATPRPAILRSSTTRRGRRGLRRGSCTPIATSSRTKSSSTATRSRTANASTAWANGPGRRGSHRCWVHGVLGRCSASTGARRGSTRTGNSTSSAATT